MFWVNGPDRFHFIFTMHQNIYIIKREFLSTLIIIIYGRAAIVEYLPSLFDHSTTSSSHEICQFNEYMWVRVMEIAKHMPAG